MLAADADKAPGALVCDPEWSWLERDCVAHHARVSPDRLACRTLIDDRRYSYAELDAAVEPWADELAASLSTPGARVALLARNSLLHVLLFYACARVGAVFVPLNWRLPGRELAPLLADCSPERLIVAPEFADAAADAMSMLEAADGARVTSADDPPTPAPARADSGASDPDAPCVLLYTSGTTGRPKGVIVTRRGGFFCGYNFIQVGGLSPASALLADAPLFHVVGLYAIMHAGLSAGAAIVIADRFVPADTLRRLGDPALAISHYFCVPQMAQALKADPTYSARALSHLQGFFTGGSPMPAALTSAFLDDGVAMSNGYGLSEAGTVMHVPPDREMAGAMLGAVGLPAPAMEVRLVGPDGVEVRDGEIGEVQLRGPAVSPGYWRQPEATAAAFVDGWFRTGDAARRDARGVYFLVDRWKDMYISGGENVYPAEVEAALLELPGVRDVAVIGVPDARWGETGCAYVVREEGSALDAAAVIGFCGARLAGFKRPARVRFVDVLPRTASGKLRKDVLRRAFAAAPASDPTDKEPHS